MDNNLYQRNLQEAANLYQQAHKLIEGKSEEQNVVEGILQLIAAAEAGHPRAQLEVSELYRTGTGVEKSQQKALFWLQKSAAQDDVIALYNLAVAYAEGKGVARNVEKAKKLLYRASAKGYSKADDKIKQIEENEKRQRTIDGREERKGKIIKWLKALIVVICIAIPSFYLIHSIYIDEKDSEAAANQYADEYIVSRVDNAMVGVYFSVQKNRGWISKSVMLYPEEVTRKLWYAVMGQYSFYMKDPMLPVTNVSWEECQEFLKRLSAKTGKKYWLLPANYYKAIANSSSLHPRYNDSKALRPQASMDDLESNTLYDMIGNAEEWVADTIHKSGKVYHKAMGGSYHTPIDQCLSHETLLEADGKSPTIGFRFAREMTEEDTK